MKTSLMLGCVLLMVGILPGCQEAEQTVACQQYVSCVRAMDQAESRVSNLERFEPNGACWGGPEGATLCDRSCERGLEWIAERYDNAPAACFAE